MKCLIDADILAYEVSSSGTYKDQDTGEAVVKDFERVAELFDQRIKEIEGECWATEPSTLYLTGDSTLGKSINRRLKYSGEEEVVFKKNFRESVAWSKPYKGQRKEEKPFHFHNLREYMLDNYHVIISNGVEADDLIAAELVKAGDKLDVICCSRDKDLRTIGGMHFGWPCGLQPQFGPERITEFGYLELDLEGKKLKGGGQAFLYAQMLTGDRVDNIPGLKNYGKKKAYNALKNCVSLEDLEVSVKNLYIEAYGDKYKFYYDEQLTLLSLLKELPEGSYYEVQPDFIQS